MNPKTLAILTTLAAFAAVPAFAADTSGTSSTATAASGATTPMNSGTNTGMNSGMNSGMSSGNIGQTLRQDLTKAGFTDIRIMPEAFVVHAKNSAGEPVMMRISPDSVTELTEVPGLPNQRLNGGMPSGSIGTAGNSTHAAK